MLADIAAQQPALAIDLSADDRNVSRSRGEAESPNMARRSKGRAPNAPGPFRRRRARGRAGRRVPVDTVAVEVKRDPGVRNGSKADLAYVRNGWKADIMAQQQLPVFTPHSPAEIALK